MKKFKKGRLFLTLTLVLILAFGSSIAALAASDASGAVAGYGTTGSSRITATSGSAMTTYQNNGSVRVSATYSYINTSTLATGTISLSEGNNRTASVSFSAPNNCRSVKVTSNHNVSIPNEHWTANTEAIY